MKKVLYIVLLLSFAFKAHGIYEFYNQQAAIALYATDSQTGDMLHNILDQFGLKYQLVDQLDPQDDQRLYIVAGELSGLSRADLPKHYIAYQTKPLGSVPVALLDILRQAYAVWDISWSNINAYRKQVNHWYYLPNEQYVYLDPVLLSCFLPLKALPAYRDLLAHSNANDTDFSSHLPVLFCHCYFQNPSIFVESGIRWGDGSTIALAKISHLLDAYLIGLDIMDCSKTYASIKNAHFACMNDTDFPAYFKNMNLGKGKVEFVFIDTSHQYQHTLDEIAAFSSVLADNGAIAFHDSNVAVASPVRINGSACPNGLGNPKGVTDGLKTYFDIEFDEAKYLNVMLEKDGYLWNLVHYPYCYGLAVAKRVQKLS